MLDTSLLPHLQKSLRTTFRRAKQSKCISNLLCLILGYRRGIVRWLKREPDLLEPVKIRCARIGEKGLTWSEPASHPSRARFGGSEAERDHEHHREVPRGPLAPLRAPGGEALRGWLPHADRP